MNSITKSLMEHYSKTFRMHGATSEGVDWSSDPADHLLRLDKMAAVLSSGSKLTGTNPTILDVGCGYGSMRDYLNDLEISLDYTGIDVCSQMIDYARKNHPLSTWITGDFLELDLVNSYDYVVCNGILTQKLEASIRDMDSYLRLLVTKMFESARIGIAFNVMTTHVNFTNPNLYYKNPVELLGWCMSSLTSKVKIDHAYPLYEYTVYLYHENALEFSHGAHKKSSL